MPQRSRSGGVPVDALWAAPTTTPAPSLSGKRQRRSHRRSVTALARLELAAKVPSHVTVGRRVLGLDWEIIAGPPLTGPAQAMGLE